MVEWRKNCGRQKIDIFLPLTVSSLIVHRSAGQLKSLPIFFLKVLRKGSEKEGYTAHTDSPPQPIALALLREAQPCHDMQEFFIRALKIFWAVIPAISYQFSKPVPS